MFSLMLFLFLGFVLFGLLSVVYVVFAACTLSSHLLLFVNLLPEYKITFDPVETPSLIRIQIVRVSSFVKGKAVNE